MDDICLIKSVKTDQFNHAPAQIFFNTGFSQPGRPCLGSWALYGLGAETQDLPATVVVSQEEMEVLCGHYHKKRRMLTVREFDAPPVLNFNEPSFSTSA